MAYWACAQVAPQQERAAQHFLQLRGFESYCPRLRVTRRQHGRKIELRPPLFVSYLFIWIVAGRWWDARWCPYVSRIILNGAQPAVVPDGVISEIKARERGGLVELPKREEFRMGEAVRVTHGPLVGCVGLYAGMRPHERCLVLLALLGGHQRVELARGDVEAAS